jgi:hypothetical protein
MLISQQLKSLKLAHDDHENGKWSAISKGMLKHGTQERWSQEAVQKKWNEIYAEQPSFGYPEYEIVPRNRHRVSSDLSVGDVSTGNSCWSDEAESSTHSLHDCDSATLMSALSTATMDEVRTRALSNANAHIHLQQQQQQQQQMMFNQQNTHRHQQHPQHQNQPHHQNGWNSGS